MASLEYTPYSYLSQLDVVAFVFVLSIFEQVVRSTKVKNDLKVLPNVALYVAPVVLASIKKKDWVALVGIFFFVFGAIVIGPAREECLFGVRRENWFHYCIAPAAMLIANGLK